MELIIITSLLIVYIIIREVLFYKQTTRLQELLKSYDIQDYYSAKKKNSHENVIEDSPDTPNEAVFNDSEFDLKNIDKVLIDGKEVPINIK